MPTRLRQRTRALFPAGSIQRYIVVGGVNTVVGLGLSMLVLFAFNHLLPAQLAGVKLTQARLTVAASVLATPFNITVAYLNYKLFVFRTRGNWLHEWMKAFGVYGVSNLIGWLGLGALTRLLEILLRGWAPMGKGTPGYFAMAAMTLVTTLISYFGHKKVTFGGSPGHDEDLAADEGISA